MEKEPANLAATVGPWHLFRALCSRKLWSVNKITLNHRKAHFRIFATLARAGQIIISSRTQLRPFPTPLSIKRRAIGLIIYLGPCSIHHDYCASTDPALSRAVIQLSIPNLDHIHM
jgi:hypothetical protein